MTRLFKCQFDYHITAQQGATFTPFIPVRGTICTLYKATKEGYKFEEVEVKYPGMTDIVFIKEVWRELTDLPTSEEIIEMVEECQLQPE